MKRIIGGVIATVLVSNLGGTARADDNPNAVVEKAIQALGGAEKLANVKAATWKGKGKLNFGGNENDFTSQTTIQDLDHFRSEFEGEVMGNKVKGVTVLSGDKGWQQFAGMTNELDKDRLASEKRNVYLMLIATMPSVMKDKGFKVEAAGEDKVADKPAVGIKVTAPDGKDFKLYFDKESGLPVKLVAKVADFTGEEKTQETTMSDYKDFDGIKKAIKTEIKRDGEKFLTQEITEFKLLDKVPPETFSEPKS
jgi:hypothetical protein